MDTLLAYLADNWTGGIWLIAGGAVVWLYLHVKNKSEKAEEKASEAHEKIDSLPCEKHRDKISAIEIMNAKLDGILQAVQPSPVKQGGYTNAHSPIALTESGWDVAKEMGIEDIICRNTKRILSLIDDSVPQKNAYDIQQFCIDAVIVSLDKLFIEEDVNRIKSFAFNKGQHIVMYSSLIGVLVRDLYFKERSINIEDVDKCDPNK